jgi:GT2 family glycosyltransferase/glycosyltransferase involved in cell wall biosynthesis/tetratricopeptide (TPR) repeat protein
MSHRPVSIVIPNYNGAATVRACVESIFDTIRHPQWELIVVDDGSTDRSLELLEQIKGIKLIRQKHQGAARALNTGFAAAGRNDVVRVHSDVAIETADWLNCFLETLEAQPKAGVVGAKLVFPDNRIYALGRNLVSGFGWHERHCDRMAFAPDSAKPGAAQEVDAVPGALAFYRREVIEAAGGMDENYAPGWTDDDDFCIAARVNGYKVIVQPAVRAVHFARAWAPTSGVYFSDQLERVRRLTWEVKQNVRKIHAAYWEKKWGWHPAHPDLNEIRRLYGHTELCWRIGEAMRFQPRQWPPTVDAAIVTWNNLPVLRRCLESLARTDYPRDRFEVFVVDNASKDGTAECLRQLATSFPFRLHVIASPVNTGCPIGLNWGVIQGQGEIVARLDDDIVVPPNWLRDLVENFRRRPYAGCVGPKFINDNARAAIQCTEFRHFPNVHGHEDEADAGQADYVARTGHIRGCCNLYRRDVFQRCDLFDLRYTPSQFDDPDHQLAVTGAGYEIIYDGRVSVVHKLTNGMIRSHAAIANGVGNMQKMYGKWGPNIFEVVEKSLDLSREGRFLPDDGDTSAYLALGPNPNEFPRKATASLKATDREFCAAANRWLSLRDADPQYVELIADHLNLAASMRRDGYPRSALDVLHTALNLGPERIDVLESLAATYSELGDTDMPARLERLIQRLTGKKEPGASDNARSERTAPCNEINAGSPQNSNARLHKSYAEIGEARSTVIRAAKPKLKVLMVNTYETRVAGGDMMQIKKTKEHLERLGCAVDIDCSPRPNPRGYDVVHLWNLWFPHQTIVQAKAIRVADPNMPLVLSTIYWDMSEKAWADAVIPRLFRDAQSEQELATHLQLLADDKLISGGVKRSKHIEPNYPGYETYQKQILEMVDALLPQSYAEMRNMQDTLGVVRPFAIVRNAAEPRVFEAATKDWFIEKYGVKDFVMTVGLVEPRKNQLLLLYALRHAKLPVVIVGRNYDRDYLRLCKKFAPARTLFIEHMPHELLASAYKAARVHALPSWMECCAFSNVEAALSGCGMVVSNKTSEPEYFGKDAYECDPADVRSIRAAVLRAYENHGRDELKRNRLREKFLREYTWERGAEQTLRTYQWAIERRSGGTVSASSQPNASATGLKSWELPGNVYAGPVSVASAPAAAVQTKAPRTSIVIPVFNNLEYTRKCIETLNATTGDPQAYEVIVVDNGSTDGTGTFLRELAAARTNVKVVTNEKNDGFARACNQGANVAEGEHLLFLNNDTEPRAGWLDALVATLESDSSIGAVGGKLLYPDGTIQHAGVVLCRDEKVNDPLLPRHVFSGEPADKAEANVTREFQALTAACVLVRGEAFRQAGGFDENFWNGYEDMDLCFRLRDKGWKLVYQPASVVMHHESKSGSERFAKVKENVQRLHQKWLHKVKPDMIVNKDGSVEIAAESILRTGPVTTAANAAKRTDPLVSIIILTHNQIEHTRRCLTSIESSTPESHEIIVVDNGSTDGTVEFLQQRAAGHASTRVIYNDTNCGFATGNNQGLAVARGQFVLLLNNDTVVNKGWLGRMLSVFERYPEAGLVGPVSNCVSGLQLVKGVSYQDLRQMDEFAAQWAVEHAGHTQEVNRLVGFCLMARRGVVERIGGLDERFGSGNFEDDDFCLRAGHVGFKARIALDAFVHHAGSATFNGARIDYRAAMLRNWKLFRRKWSLPADAPIEKGYRLPLTLAKGESLVVPLQRSEQAAKVEAAKPARRGLPSVAKIGQLDEARALFSQKRELLPAWKAALAAIEARPFHPEAHLLLAQIAKAADDISLARRCAQRGDRMAPKWKCEQFLRSLPNKSKAGVVSTADWPALPEPPREPRLSVCLIAKNEEAHLDRCLASVRPLAHQMIVVDTGSTDRTAEIAKQHGAEVYSFAWSDDFSAARNAALEHATGDWVLSLDADEELPAESQAKLREHLRDPKAMAFRLPLVDHGQEAEGRSLVPRLFRNAPGLFWTGRVHEQVFGGVEALRKGWHLENKLGEATILHHGYSTDAAQQRAKSERNLRLLKLALEEQPNDANLLMSLGLELTRSGQLDAGIEQYRRAVDALANRSAGEVAPELLETLLTQLCTHWAAKKNFAEIVRLLHSPLAQSRPLTASLHFVLGLSYMELKRFDEAEEEFRQCLAKRNEPVLSPIHKDIHTTAPQHCLALCLAQTGKVVEALKILHQIVTERADDAAAWTLGGSLALQHPDFLEFASDWTGEAVKHVPGNVAIMAQRAEALLLSGQAREAANAWQRLPESPQVLAALVICETPPSTIPPELEVAVSHEFLRLYRRLINFGATQQTLRINERLDWLQSMLPTAAKFLAAAFAEAMELSAK